MSKVAVVFWSGTGNTEIMANSVVEGVKKAGKDVDLFTASEFNASKAEEYDRIAFGCPSMGAEVLEEAEFEPMYTEVETKISGKKVALFGSYGWGDGQWMREWQERAEGKGAILVDDGLIVNETPDDEGKALCVALGEKLGA